MVITILLVTTIEMLWTESRTIKRYNRQDFVIILIGGEKPEELLRIKFSYAGCSCLS